MKEKVKISDGTIKATGYYSICLYDTSIHNAEVISVKITDISTDESFEQKFILREYDYDNFVLSFQAE